ncbi:MAG: methylmalonyl-CoA mutase family protein [Reichenbachiella sp.]|uniref:methylmalonyl-CoA mutase family protein n=1 Tax=Reichenbachiella sp. TaxID=2184521 RepID=UPI003262FD2D
MIKDYTFDEFEKPSRLQWIEKLNKDLGEDIAKRISTWTSERNLDLSAYYDRNDVTDISPVPTPPNLSWKYLQTFDSNDTNAELLDALMNGADGAILEESVIPSLDKILNKVAPEHCTLAIRTSNLESYQTYCKWVDANLGESQQSEVLLFGDFTTVASQTSPSRLSFLLGSFVKGQTRKHKTTCLDSGLIQSMGGSAQLELSYLLSQSTYYINSLLDQGHDVEQVLDSLFISTAVGSNFFLELAKIRAMRMLMSQITKAYGATDVHIPIHAKTSPFTKSAIDANTNFLRCSTESMSAALAGVDYLSINPHHNIKSGERIARNISNLLKEESHFAKTLDPSAGSYYVEQLTQQLAKKAWQSFQELERKGGFEAAITKEYFEKEIMADFEFQKARIITGSRKMVGVNDFGNQDEKIDKDQLSYEYPSIAEDFEHVRMWVETYVQNKGENDRPQIYLVGVGTNAKMMNARFTFATNFFNWSGMKVNKYNGQHLTKNAIIVCCGADDDYSEAVIFKALESLPADTEVLAAGKEHAEASDRISAWINVKSNRLAMIKDILTRMDITQNLLSL